MTNEIWHKCEVPYTRYEVSNLGRVRNALTGLVLRPRKHNWGYQKVILSYQGQRKECTVHNLVATAFVEGWREGLEVNHKNGVKTDNRAENLEWVTSSENHQHAHDVLLLDVKPVALLDERGHLQWLFKSSMACNRAMGGRVREHIRKKCRYRGFRPRYISVPMYREIVHLVNVHHYTLHSAWIEACALSADESPSGGSKRCARSNGSNCSFSAEATKAAKPSAMQQSCGSNGNQSTMQPAVGADSRVCPNNTQPATQAGEANHNYQLSTINYQLSDEA